MSISLAGAEEAVRLHKRIQLLTGFRDWITKKHVPGVVEVKVIGTSDGTITLPAHILIEQLENDISWLKDDLENIS